MSAAVANVFDLQQEVRLRPGTAADARFLLDSWLRSYRAFVAGVSSVIYYQGQREVVMRILQRASVLVACNPEDPSQIYGWATFERRGPVTVLHYVYIKSPFRRLGLAKMLLSAVSAQGCHYTHHTPAGEELCRSFGGHFNPYLAGVLS